MTDTPNLDKIIAKKDEAQIVQDFIGWYCDEYLTPGSQFYLHADSGERQREAVMARYFGIDLKEAEKERMALLQAVRQVNHMREVLDRRKAKT